MPATILSLPSVTDCATVPPQQRHRLEIVPAFPRIKDQTMTYFKFPRTLALPARQPGETTSTSFAAAVLAALFFASIIATSASVQSAAAQGADPVVARVNGVDIHQSDLAIAEEEIGSNVPSQPPEAKRDYLINFVANMILLAKAAEAKNLADSTDFKQRMAFAHNKVLMEMLLQSTAKAALTDEAMHKVYDEASKQMANEEEVHARHILVETEAEAKAISAELKKGADFAQLAKQKSKDPGASEGGDLGYFTKDQMVPEFAEVAFKLDKGQISDPVKTQFGWHIIKVEDKRKRQIPEFDKVKDQIESFLERKAQGELVAKIRSEGKIERLDQPAASDPKK
jgi:peptidyl-prolyl cis-trans isomerase C